MANTSITAAYENLPKIVKLILQFFFGGFIAHVYRIIRFVETKNIVTLVVGIICCFGIGVVFWVIDFITELFSNKISVFAA